MFKQAFSFLSVQLTFGNINRLYSLLVFLLFLNLYFNSLLWDVFSIF